MNIVNIKLSFIKLQKFIKEKSFLYPFLRFVRWKILFPVFDVLSDWIRSLIIFGKERKLLSLSNNELKLVGLKDSHKGEIAFIVGNGPSLNVSDLETLKNKKIFCFGTNRINLLFDRTLWRPDCYMAYDVQIFRDGDQTVPNTLNENLPLYLFGSEVYSCLKSSDKDKDNVIGFKVKKQSYYKQVDKFSINPLKYVFDGFTVTYVALQLAYYMGFSKIVLLGVDCNYSKIKKMDGTVIDTGNSNNYFDSKYDKSNSNSGYIDGMIQSYITARKFSSDNNFKIINASRGGNLDVFERVDFESIISEL